MSGLLDAPWKVAAAVAAAAAVLVGAATVVGPPESVVRDRPGRVEPVVRTTLVCPYVGGEERAVGLVGVLPLPDVGTAEPGRPGGSASASRLTVEALVGDAAPPAPLLELDARGAPAVVTVEAAETQGYAVRATGPMAPGVAAEQSVLAQGADLRGLADSTCAEPAREHWFVGPSGEVGRRARLILSNPSDSPAVADVSVWDEAGPVDAPGADDLGVPARSQRVVLLDALAPESARVGLHVSVAEGRLAAAVEVRETAGLDAQGISAVPAATAPAESLVVPGVPGRGQRVLRILAPGGSDAIVALRLLGAEGPFSPVDQDVVTVPGGSVAEVPLTDAAGESPVAVLLDSDVPVTAAVRVVDQPPEGLPDVAYTAAAAPLAGPAASLLGRATPELAASLLLSAVGDDPAAATVTTLADDGSEVASEPVSVAAGATLTVPLSAPEGLDRVTVVVTPEEPGTLAAARVVAGTDPSGALLDIVPLVSPRTTVSVPEVAGELPTGLRPPEREALQ
ncbi:MAG TPA: DUF5719 family protein [Jiangellales bacterium]|nr:DUF5719 family protein [Jiangellales bacterium]